MNWQQLNRIKYLVIFKSTEIKALKYLKSWLNELVIIKKISSKFYSIK